MSRNDARLTRTSAVTDGRTLTDVTSTQRGGGLVDAAVRAARARRALAEGVDAAARWIAGTVRPSGVILAVVASAGLACGVVFGWVEWMVAGAIALLLLAMAIPFLFGVRSYRVDLRLPHLRIIAGTSVTAGITVTGDGTRIALPGRIDIPVGDGLVEFGVPLLRPGHVVEETLELPPQRRGVIVVGPATTVRSDPLGLLRREHAFDDEYRLFVHPRTVALPSTSAGLLRDLDGSPTRRLVDADMSFHAIREYASGDSQRQIHWKSTAKTGQLMVRQYEESRRSRMAVVLGVAGEEFADDDEFELAVGCAASLGLRAIQDAREIDVVVGAEIPRVVKGRLRAIRHLPAASPRVLLDSFSGVDILDDTMRVEDVCALVAEGSDRLSIAVVVVGSTVDANRLRQAALAYSADTVVVGVLCDERAHPRLRTLGGIPVLTVGTVEDLAGLLHRGATG